MFILFEKLLGSQCSATAPQCVSSATSITAWASNCKLQIPVPKSRPLQARVGRRDKGGGATCCNRAIADAQENIPLSEQYAQPGYCCLARGRQTFATHPPSTARAYPMKDCSTAPNQAVNACCNQRSNKTIEAGGGNSC